MRTGFRQNIKTFSMKISEIIFVLQTAEWNPTTKKM